MRLLQLQLMVRRGEKEALSLVFHKAYYGEKRLRTHPPAGGPFYYNSSVRSAFRER